MGPSFLPSQVLTHHQQQMAAGTVTQADARRMDGAMLAIGVMVDLLKHKVREITNHRVDLL